MGQRRKNEETVPEEETGGKFEPVAKLSNEQVDSKSGEEMKLRNSLYVRS